MNRHIWGGALLSGVLMACDSGGPNDTELQSSVDRLSATTPDSTVTSSVHFEGIWEGALTLDGSAYVSPAIVLVNGWGEFRLLGDDVQFVGFPRRTQATIDGVVTGISAVGTTWSDGSRINQFSVTGSIDENESIFARIEGPDTGTFSVNWAAAEGTSQIGNIDGIWALHDENQNIVATIQFDAYDGWSAQVFGSHVNGCTYSGHSEAWTSAQSYDISPLELTGCPLINGANQNGSYSGTAALMDLPGDSSNNLVLVAAISNHANQMVFYLDRILE